LIGFHHEPVQDRESGHLSNIKVVYLTDVLRRTLCYNVGWKQIPDRHQDVPTLTMMPFS
jgi:hypothetical protein